MSMAIGHALRLPRIALAAGRHSTVGEYHVASMALASWWLETRYREVEMRTGSAQNPRRESQRLTSAIEEGAAEAVRVALLGPEGPTGRSRTRGSARSRAEPW